MVDALHEVHRALVCGGLVIDVRPDTEVRRRTRIERRGRIVGDVQREPEAVGDDTSANQAVARVIADRLFDSVERGHFWFRSRFGSRVELEEYLGTSSRLSTHSWRPEVRSHVRSWQSDRFTLRRSVQFEVLRARR